MKNGRKKQEQIHLCAHGEDYGNWMPVSMLQLVGGLAVLAAVLSLLSLAVFHITALGVVFVIAALLLLALLLWITWIRRQYAFGSGGMMEQGRHIPDLYHTKSYRTQNENTTGKQPYRH